MSSSSFLPFSPSKTASSSSFEVQILSLYSPFLHVNLKPSSRPQMNPPKLTFPSSLPLLPSPSKVPSSQTPRSNLALPSLPSPPRMVPPPNQTPSHWLSRRGTRRRRHLLRVSGAREKEPTDRDIEAEADDLLLLPRSSIFSSILQPSAS